MKDIKKLMITLVALLALTTGAWAQSTLAVAEVEIPAAWQDDVTVLTAGDLSGFKTATLDEAKAWADVPATGAAILIYGFDGGKVKYAQFQNGTFKKDGSSQLTRKYIYTNQSVVKFCYTAIPVALTRGTGDKINEWSFTNGMPAGNVKVWPVYFPQATMTDGAVVAVDGVKATTDYPLVFVDPAKLTGTKKMMYYVSTDAEATAPAYDAEGWTDQMPTAANYTEAGNVNVWYYPVGTDNGVDGATATYSDGNICATALQVPLAAAPLWKAMFDLSNAPAVDKAAGVWTTNITGDGAIKGTNVTVNYSGSRKVTGINAEVYNPIAIPLTMEVIEGSEENSTIRIHIDATLPSGMKYSVNGGEKKMVTASTNIEGLNVGDKVQFYGNGTQTQVYGKQGQLVKLAGGSAKVKVYGNIMSLVDETGFATVTKLPQQNYVFYKLFINNTNLIDASGLLLPATQLASYCYQYMFQGCTNLTAGPQELPATEGYTFCYQGMFSNCTSLTAAPKIFLTGNPPNRACTKMFENCSNLKEVYVKPAFSGNYTFDNMFSGTSSLGAVLHTTPENAGSWNGHCNSWTVKGDWPTGSVPTPYTVTEPSVINVDWNAETKTGTFTMPGKDMVLKPIYAPAAQFAVVDNMAQLPAVAEGIYAATSAPLITAGTAVEGQGNVMYLATTDGSLTAEQAKAASGWSETLPTAEGFADNTMIAYVWYYIQATDAYNDSEPVCIPITFLDNKFNLTLNAANAYTIDATQTSKGTVTVAGTDMTSAIAEGKLNAVTVGSEVKLNTATGYKFRKVEVKKDKDSSNPLATPMTIKALTDGTIVVYRAIRYTYGIKYSVNGGDKMVMDQETYTINVNAGDEVQFYGNGTNIKDYGYINEEQNIDKTVIGGTAKMKVFGNIMSLLDEENFATNTDLPDANQSSYFWKLFNENTNLTDASGLLLPSTTLATYCYGGLFYGCTSLTAGPELPATQMAKDCYSDMFNGCTSLTKAPKLPATTLAEKCYFRMFRNCTSLTSVYVKAGYAAAQRECSSMFDGTSTAAVLNTTSGSQSSWETMMGTGKTWDSWTVSADWTE